MVLWVIAASALAIALLALLHARRAARQLAQLTEMYWQLKFDHGELKARVEPSSPPANTPSPGFVPLTRLRQGSGEAGPR
ncbi:MAG: hypothetical protein FJW22_07020 [Acidimicrobiia bacterium]|nr:hypothetical protein [Acidimicrobiia bacterium]